MTLLSLPSCLPNLFLFLFITKKKMKAKWFWNLTETIQQISNRNRTGTLYCHKESFFSVCISLSTKLTCILSTEDISLGKQTAYCSCLDVSREYT